MDSDYAAAYEDLYRRHWWWRARQNLIARVLTRFKPADGWESILDIGCGDGLAFDLLLQFGRVVRGIERDEQVVTNGPFRHMIYVGSFDNEYPSDRAFSLITMLDVLEHMEDADAALRFARSLAAPDALILITVPAFRSLWTSHDDLNHHFTRYTKKTMDELLIRAGLKTLHWEYFFHWVAPVKWLLRLRERVFDVGSPSIPRVPPKIVNATLHAISRLEQGIPPRLKPPFGSSLLVLAQFGEQRSHEGRPASAITQNGAGDD